MKFIKMFFLFFSCALCVTAQDYFSDIRKVSDVFKSDNFSANMEVLTYNQYGKVTNKTNALLIRLRGRYYSKYNNVEIIQEQNTSLIVDHSGKSITYFNYDSQNALNAFNVDNEILKLKNSIDTVVFLGDNKGVRGYELISHPNSLIQKARVYFNVSDFTFTKIEYVYNSNLEEFDSDMSTAVITYENFNLRETNGNKIPKINSFVKISKNKFTLNENFKNYKLEITE